MPKQRLATLLTVGERSVTDVQTTFPLNNRDLNVDLP